MNAAVQSNAVAKIEPRQGGVVADVRRMEKQFALALPEHVSPEKFVRVVMTAINTNPDLQKADRESVLGAAMKCAQDGLLPDGREAALVVYGNKASYLPMIAGVLAKVRRSGELLTISAHVAYDKDAFTYTLGDDEKIEHQPYMEGPRGKPIAVYAVAKTKDGGIYREVMSLEQVNQVRNVSRAKNAGPWVQWWDEMARKTVLRRLAKRLPMSTDLQQVFQRDDEHYDLSRAAQGAATMRRLHANFEEEAPQSPAAEVAEIADEPAAGSADPAGDDVPPSEAGSSQHPARAWAQTLREDLDADAFEGVAELDAFCGADENARHFADLEAIDAAAAKSLNAQIQGKRKALASKERG